LSAIWAIRSRDKKPPPAPWQIIANHMGTFPDLCRWGDLAWQHGKPPAARAVFALVDLFGTGSVTAAAFADFAECQKDKDQGSTPSPELGAALAG